MSLWYPAEKGGQEDLTFGDYVTLLASELGPASPEQVRTTVEEHASFLRTRAKMSEGDIERWLARPMRAIPRARPLAKAVPLVLVATRARLPILHIYEQLDAFMAPDFSLLRSLPGADVRLVRANHLHHMHFTTVGEAAGQFPALAQVTHADARTAQAWGDVANATVAFLTATLADAPGRARIDRALSHLGSTLAVTKKLTRSE